MEETKQAKVAIEFSLEKFGRLQKDDGFALELLKRMFEEWERSQKGQESNKEDYTK